jgi:CubicO group peptidase (beta-lactamase class C family)
LFTLTGLTFLGTSLAVHEATWAHEPGLPLQSTSRITPALRADFDTYLAGALLRYDVPGAVLAVVENGTTVYSKALGKRARYSEAPVDADTLFMIGSVTKSMTSLMMASQVEHGRLDWNTKVTQILPSFALSDPQSTPQICVRDLVNHASGVARYDLPLVLEKNPPTRMIASLAEIPVVAPPGQTYHYSNQMYATGGFVAALVAGARYEDRSLDAVYSALMQTRVFDPIGMRRTTLDLDEALRSPNHATPHAWDPLAAEVTEVESGFERFASAIAPAGAVWSSLDEMARYAITQMGGVAPSGTRVISASALQVTQTKEIEVQPGVGYGMGWAIVDNFNGQRALTHDGGTAGFASLVVLLPDTNFGVVVLTNNRDGGASFNSAAWNYIYQGAFGIEHQGEDAIYQAYQDERAALAAIVESSPPVTWRETTSYLGAYQHHIGVAFEPRAGFTLRTAFGDLPMISLAQLGQPGVYATAGTWYGIVAQFSPDSLTLGDGESETSDWTLARLTAPQGHRGLPGWHWPSHIRHPAFRHPLH